MNCVQGPPPSSWSSRRRDCHHGSGGAFSLIKLRYVGLGGRRARYVEYDS